MDPHLTPDDDELDRSGATGFLRAHGGAFGGLLVALLVVVVAGPTIADRIDDGLRHESAAAPLLAPASTTVEPGSSTVASSAAPAVPATTTAPTTAATTPVTVPTTTAPVPVTTIQTVPAVRDVIIEVGGQRMATDAGGAITLTGDEVDATVRVIGTVARPAVQTVDFAMWADGSAVAERPLDSLSGPVAQVGLVLRSRVVVRGAEPGQVGTTASFTSNVGDIDLTVDEPSWVPAAVAVASPDGLAPVAATYSLQAVSEGTPSGSQDFRPTPEATWQISS